MANQENASDCLVGCLHNIVQTPAQGADVFDEILGFMETLTRRYRFDEQAVADTVVRAIERKFLDQNGFHRLENWKGWFFQTAKWRSVSKARHERRFGPMVAEPFAVPEDEQTGHEEVLAVTKAIDQLPANWREVFVYCVVEGHTRQDASTEFSLSLGTIHRRLATAYGLVRKNLRAEGFEVSAVKKPKNKR